MMELEGICWNIPIRIGGMEFAHNFFVTRTNLGNKDMILGQPWLFSYLTKIDYVHDMGVTIQIYENGDRKGRSVLIHLPLVKAPQNMMPVSLHRSCESNSIEWVTHPEFVLTRLGDDPRSEAVPKFMRSAVEVLQIPDVELEKSRPLGLKEDLVIEASQSMPFFAEVVKKAWFASIKSDTETLSECVEDLKRSIGIAPIYASSYTS